MPIEKVKGDEQKKAARLEKEQKKVPDVSIDDQMRLAEILNDSPRLVSLNGTNWEVRALRMGTQYLIAQKVLEITKNENDSFGDVVRHFAKSIPAVLDIVTLCLLNDKKKIYKDGDVSLGFSDLYHATRSTLEWDCDVTKFGEILINVLQMLDVSFFLQSLGTLDVFRQLVTKKKRMRTDGQE